MFIPIKHVVVNQLGIRCPKVEIEDILKVSAGENMTLIIAFRTVSALSYYTERQVYLAQWDPMHRKHQLGTKSWSLCYENDADAKPTSGKYQG